MIMHVQADTMMQNTGPGKVHTQFNFLNFFGFFFLIFWGYPQQTNSNAAAYIPELCIQLMPKTLSPRCGESLSSSNPELTQTIDQSYIAMHKRCPVTYKS